MSVNLNKTVLNSIANNCLTCGDFSLSSGEKTQYYVDMRSLLGHPNDMEKLARLMIEYCHKFFPNSDLICGVPYGGIPIATLISIYINKPLIMPRKEPKKYGKCQIIEGKFNKGDRVIIIEDVITTGASLLDTIKILEKEGLIIEGVLVILNRQADGIRNVMEAGYKIQTLYNIVNLFKHLYYQHNYTNKSLIQSLYIKYSDVNIIKANDYYIKKKSIVNSSGYQKKLLSIIINKKTNLCVALDMKNTSQLLKIADMIGPYVCIIKIHSDIWASDEQSSSLNTLNKLGQTHNFMIMDDRKLADIGHTTLYQIRNLHADLVTIHSFSITPEILNENIGLIVIESMSHDSGKKLMDMNYISKTKNLIRPMAERENNIIGMVSQDSTLSKNNYNNPYIYMMPGVNMNPVKINDQNYVSIEEAFSRGTDIIIVGRDIWQRDESEIVDITKQYQQKGWDSVVSIISPEI